MARILSDKVFFLRVRSHARFLRSTNRFVLFSFVFLSYPVFSESSAALPNRGNITRVRLPINLDQAILIGTTNNVILRTLDSKKEISKMVITERWREFLPKVGVQYLGLRNVNTGSIDNLYNDVRLTVQQLVFDGGEAGLQVEIAKMNDVLNEQDFKINAAKVKLEIQKSYMKALAAKGKILLGRKSIEKMEESLKKAKVEFSQGLITKVQLMEATNKIKQAQFTFLKYKNESNQSLLELKQVLSLDYHVDLDLEENIYTDISISEPKFDVEETIIRAINTREDLKKSQVVVRKLKNEKKIADNYWIPKIYLGGYAGKNGNDFPLRHDIYGLNFNLVIPFGSSVVQSNGSLGVQKDGTGIQTYPGFGNQTVGPGLNGYESSSIKFFDNLAYSRKIVEGEVQLAEALLNFKNLENQVAVEVQKSLDRSVEAWELLKISNSRVLLQWESLKISNTKLNVGQSKKEELLNSELEFVRSEQELTDSLVNYMISCYEAAHVANLDVTQKKLIRIQKGKGNSLIGALLQNKDTKSVAGLDSADPMKTDSFPGAN
ncbi:TolC family protein [Leptospira langatensis]|uniref:TolC family protein n=1 Tax=Leptospira langatensis TaxID=2484983 RepID=A0A5F1ZPC4_9LEPT|nr:TolC family protein [Leptospira langatensis]TGK05451.1 TolC family protein [Leptospira langatensis]TGL38587.1 TolC family protein [Leptospira langatensis]